MARFTVDDIRRILRECAGEPDSVDLDSDIGSVAFEDMGYDSLARLELAARIQQEFLVAIPDEKVEELKTPDDVVGYVTSRIPAA
ncbi:actinorhodin polyketide synthase acyl carrier protein [Actinomadura rubrobrunea]|uniref:Actinorhodin polyketide synthase acyl carrier protein n=1 Tax=Actinomadura rubrobrunea TaxID=115335 RepID=A0A9W6PVH4_9ACTN|nr:acyl carrier protein [Actinomadura rubrobrunea]GLW63956.1 actinorhodin polyketide synthase acyl carrier protein [Actinomadura rubrobrunea]